MAVLAPVSPHSGLPALLLDACGRARLDLPGAGTAGTKDDYLSQVLRVPSRKVAGSDTEWQEF